MKKMFLALLGTALASSMAYGAICPTTTSTNSDCGYILTIASDGSITGAPVVGANPTTARMMRWSGLSTI